MTEDDDRFKQLDKPLKQSDDQLRQLRQHLKRLPESKQIELLKQLARPGPAKPLSRLNYHYLPGQKLPPMLQESADFVLKHRDDPAYRQTVKLVSVWLTAELGTPLWDPAYRRRPAKKPRTTKQRRIFDHIQKTLPDNLSLDDRIRQTEKAWSKGCDALGIKNFTPDHRTIAEHARAYLQTNNNP